MEVSRLPAIGLINVKQILMNGGTMIELTGLWKNTSKDGKTYLSGKLSFAKVVILPNDFKKNSNDPDFYLCIAEGKKREDGETGHQADSHSHDPF